MFWLNVVLVKCCVGWILYWLNAQLYKNRFCELVLIPVVINNIRSKCGTFDWLMQECKKHLIHITLLSFQKHCSLFSFGYSDILKSIMVNKTKCFPKPIPTSWHKPVYLSEIQTKYLCLHYVGSLGCLWKKESTKFVKEYQSESESKCFLL